MVGVVVGLKLPNLKKFQSPKGWAARPAQSKIKKNPTLEVEHRKFFCLLLKQPPPKMPNAPGTAFKTRIPKNRLAAARKSNAPIRRVYRKKNGLKKPAQNKKAVLKLSRQVKTLQLQRYGDRQWQTQFCRLTSTVAGQFPYKEHPVAFLLNSFYNNDTVYRGDIQQPSGVPSGLPIGPNTVFTKQLFDTNIDSRFQWLAINNQELVSQTQYLPIATKLNFRIRSRLVDTINEPVKFRISIIKLKRQPQGAGPATLMSLPTYLGAYRALASDDFRDRNRFSKIRHTVLFDRWITFNPPSNTGATSKLVYNCYYNHYFKGINPVNKNQHLEPGPIVDQDLITNIPEKDLVWCLISCNASAFVQSQFTIDMQRVNTWRDHKGVTTI